MNNNSFSLKAIRFLSTLFLYFGYFCAGMVAIIFLLRLSEVKAADKFKVGFPVPVHYERSGVVSGDMAAELEFEEANIEIALSGVPTSVFAINILLILLVLGVIIYCTRLFLKSIKSIGEGEVFHIDNINRFKRIGLLMVVSSFLPPFYLFSILAGLSPEFEGVRFTYSYGPNLGLMLSGFFLIVIAEIFKRGLEIKEENELTV